MGAPRGTQAASHTPERVTIPTLHRMAAKDERITVVAAYDVTFARMFDEAGVDAILVGDSLGMVIQGHDTTLPVTVDEVIYHCRAVARGTRRAHLIGDMPFMSYQASEDDALRNAGRMLSEGGAHAVKLEGGEAMAKTIARLVSVGIPVMAHVGLTPQSVHAMGGFKVQGKGDDNADRVLRDAVAVSDAGAYAVVLEGIPRDLAREVTRRIAVPTIGIGAGPDVSGQVLVGYDLLGLAPGPSPKFVQRYAEMFTDGVAATRRYCEEVRTGAFPTDAHSFHDSHAVPGGAEVRYGAA